MRSEQNILDNFFTGHTVMIMPSRIKGLIIILKHTNRKSCFIANPKIKICTNSYPGCIWSNNNAFELNKEYLIYCQYVLVEKINIKKSRRYPNSFIDLCKANKEWI